MSFGYFLIHIAETLGELRRDALLVAYAQILQSEGFGMASLCTHASPFGGSIAIGPFNEV